jgi:hypothetical protein
MSSTSDFARIYVPNWCTQMHPVHTS